MSANAESTRWWENYLVRYLTPSIAGALIVNWVVGENDALRTMLYLPSPADKQTGISTQQLTLLFLYGNLFCYIASYPILVFHATRSLLFAEDGGAPKFRPGIADGYLWSVLLGFVAMLATRCGSAGLYLAFAGVTAFSGIQIFQLWIGYRGGRIYAFLHRLGQKRSGCSTGRRPASADFCGPNDSQAESDCCETQNHQATADCRLKLVHEVTTSYRHLREHGNTAFILLLELTLAGLSSAVIASSGPSATYQLSILALLISIWILPAMYVHLLGQYLERRFSTDESFHFLTEKMKP